MIRRLMIYSLLLVALPDCEPNKAPPTPLDVTPETIQAAQISQIQRLDPYTIKQGDRVHSIETQEIISGQGPIKNMSREWVTTVTELKSEGSWREITTLQEIRENKEGEDFTYEIKNVFAIPEIEASQLLKPLFAGRGRIHQKSIQQRLQSLSSEGLEVTGIAYQNLQVRPVPLAPPALVKSGQNCKGLPDCRIQAELLTYDILFQISDGSTQKHTVEWYVSTDVPFFAGLLKQCATTLVPIEQIRVLLKQCEEVVDFDFGTSSQPLPSPQTKQ